MVKKTKKKKCGSCRRKAPLKKLIMKSGADCYLYVCECGRTSQYVKKSTLTSKEMNNAELYKNNSSFGCEYDGCTNMGYEYHHIAPHHKFDDSSNWPGVNLCKKHHEEWHKVMTPNMSGRVN